MHRVFSISGFLSLFLLCACLFWTTGAGATPANRIALDRYFDRYLARSLNNCTTCHLPQTTGKTPTSLADFPHNPFGHRLAVLGETLRKAGKRADIPTRLAAISGEDSDGDGVDNLTELLLGHAPGNPGDRPASKELAEAAPKKASFAKYLTSYRWLPFESVHRPSVPKVKNAAWVRNPIDSFIAAEQEARHLHPRPEAPKAVLLRRLSLDLVGLSPTPEEIRAFENDKSSNAYEKVVDRLLASPRYGERWGRHWMDVWRYSDWAGWADGNQIRDSKPFIWRWRDWIVESLNKDKGYDRMAQEMLAADELCPEDTDAQRATGFLVRNFKLLSREQWLEDTMNHTSKAFLGVTMHCAKCHNHMYDPITQEDYYRMRAIFEPHNVRTDRIPGQPDTAKDGLVHAYDAEPKAPTYLFIRGDERNPEKDHVMEPGVPSSLGGTFTVASVTLPRLAAQPDKRDFVIQETTSASEKAVSDARAALNKLQADAAPALDKKADAALNLRIAEARHTALLAVLRAERLEDDGKKTTEEWKQAAQEANRAQRMQAVAEAELALLAAQRAQAAAQAKLDTAGKGKDQNIINRSTADLKALLAKTAEAEKALKAAQAEQQMPPATAYKPRPTTAYPAESTGRRLAFARWLTDPKNPLTARVAVNHLWTRHFGQGIVPSTADFGRNGRLPSHPQLLDWLAAEFMEKGWSMKTLHRLMVTSSTYRMASTPEEADLKQDPDNVYLWRMSSRRMEAEVVRDNVLYVAGHLDETRGGPEIDQNLALTSRRRSIYLRIAAEKQPEFMQVFDGPSVTECYERKPSVMPQQALALANSELTLREARLLAQDLNKLSGTDPNRFIAEAFLRVLARRPTAEEQRLCQTFLTEQTQKLAPAKTGVQPAASSGEKQKTESDPALRARENLILVLFNHNDFVTIR